MRITFLLMMVCYSLVVSAGDKKLEEKADAIVAEAKKLYRSEMASWYGTDIFLNNYADKNKIGGYFSYTEGPHSKCIFYSLSEPAMVIGTITFDSTFNTADAALDMAERPFTSLEKEYYGLKSIAAKAIAADSFFKVYNSTSFNMIPLIEGDDRKVYVLTGTRLNNIIIFGNDYLLEYNSQNELLRKKRFHLSMVSLNYGEEEGQEKSPGAGHTHLPETGDFITATDVCTLMLYQPFTKWVTHVVVSKDYFSFWNCEKQKLTIIPSKDIPEEYRQK